jgi:HD-GYP domain-containing protein (c-di-GMP phosphodiesterase class II)
MMEKADNEHLAKCRDIINQLSIALRTARLHDIENIAVTNVIAKLQDLLNSYKESDTVLKLELAGDFFYINNTLVKYPLEFLLNFDYLSKEFRKRELGSISFLSSPDMNDLKVLLKALVKTSDMNTAFDTMVAMLENLNTIQVGVLQEIKTNEEALDKRRLAKMTYFNAVSYTKGVMSKIRAGDKVNMRKAKRVVGALVDVVFEDEQFLIGMTSIKDYDDYTYNHCVNVAILSIAIGQKIGFSRPDLILLGLVALLHDIGKASIPIEILNKPTSFNEEEWRIVERHPYLGALSILKLKGVDKSSILSAIVAFQHHMQFDLSGYPKMLELIEQDFYSKIVTVADQYDAMTSSRVYARFPHAPDKALSIMMERSGREIDPVLYKFFVNMVGVYPIGSIVYLNTREMGLVYECNHLNAERPRVMIISDESGNKIEGPVIDLTDRDQDGNYLWNIKKTLDPNKHKINLAEYLL